MKKSLGEQKQQLNNRLFAQLTKKQTGKSVAIMDKVLRNMHEDLDSDKSENRKDGTNTFLKLFNHLMPKEAGVLINNTTNSLKIGGRGGLEVIRSLSEFMSERADKINALELRSVPEVRSEPEKKKLPAGLPIN